MINCKIKRLQYSFILTLWYAYFDANKLVYLLTTYLRSTHRFSRDYWIQSVCPGIQVSASGCTDIPVPRWTVLIGVWISQSWSPPFSCYSWPCSSALQNNEIRPKMFCCFWFNTLELRGRALILLEDFGAVQLYLLTYLLLSVRDPSLTLTQFCARLKTVLFRRAYETLA